MSVIHDSWRLRWTGWRNRVLSSAGFQRFAARFPLTRPVARHHARGLFDLVAGFTYSQTLAACVDLGLIDALAEAPRAADAVAARIGLPVEGTVRLLRAAAALDLAERVGDMWTLGIAGAALRGNRGVAEMIAHHVALYADLADPVALLRRGGGGGELARYWQYAGEPGAGEEARVAAYSRLMAASQPLVADQVIDAYPLTRHRRLLDVGGGEGAFLAAVGRRAPHLALGLFDLPAVGVRAGALTRTGATIHGGDFLHDSLPTGYDLITLIRILHDHDDAAALTLLKAVHTALPPGGRLLIAEPMAGTHGARPAGDAYFGLYLLAMGSGRPRTAPEICAMLRDAGFSRSRERRTALPITARVIVADR